MRTKSFQSRIIGVWLETTPRTDDCRGNFANERTLPAGAGRWTLAGINCSVYELL